MNSRINILQTWENTRTVLEPNCPVNAQHGTWSKRLTDLDPFHPFCPLQENGQFMLAVESSPKSAPHNQNSRIFMNIHDTSRYLPNFKNWSVRLPTAFPKSWNQLRGTVSRFPWTWLALMLKASAPRKKHEKWGVMAIIHGWFHNGQCLLWYVMISYDYMIFLSNQKFNDHRKFGNGIMLNMVVFLNVHFNNSENEIVCLAI